MAALGAALDSEEEEDDGGEDEDSEEATEKEKEEEEEEEEEESWGEEGSDEEVQWGATSAVSGGEAAAVFEVKQSAPKPWARWGWLLLCLRKRAHTSMRARTQTHAPVTGAGAGPLEPRATAQETLRP